MSKSIARSLAPTESSAGQPESDPLRGLARRIERHQKAVRQGHCTVVDHGFEIGRLLLRAKERVPKRCFQKFLTRSFGAGTTAVSVRMCERYMKIAETLREALDLALDDFDLPNATRVSQMPAFQALGLTSLRQILAISCEVDNTNETTTESPPQAAARLIDGRPIDLPVKHAGTDIATVGVVCAPGDNTAEADQCSDYDAALCRLESDLSPATKSPHDAHLNLPGGFRVPVLPQRRIHWEDPRTPQDIVERVNRVLGEIDHDPAAGHGTRHAAAP